MLKQSFNASDVKQVITAADARKWKISTYYGNVDEACSALNLLWHSSEHCIGNLRSSVRKGKITYTAASLSDAMIIKLLDRYVRRIYKISMPDRHKKLQQLKQLLTDQSSLYLIRFDIKSCFESIGLKKLKDKLASDHLVSPRCIQIIKGLISKLPDPDDPGLPRGLRISPTLAEIYLRELDNFISSNLFVVFNIRYVDDVIVIAHQEKSNEVLNQIDEFLSRIGLARNNDSEKFYQNNMQEATFDYLGYRIKVSPGKQSNAVCFSISESKLQRIKLKISYAVMAFKKDRNLQLLKNRLKYLSMLKVVVNGPNGKLLGGIAHNYKMVTDEYESLKSVDKFLISKLLSIQHLVTATELKSIKSISFYLNVRRMRVANFNKRQINAITPIWNNV